MSIYDNATSSVREKRTSKEATSPKKILNDKSLKDIVKQMKSGPKTAKEVLYDHEGNVIGILQRNDTPHFFSSNELKDFLKIAED